MPQEAQAFINLTPHTLSALLAGTVELPQSPISTSRIVWELPEGVWQEAIPHRAVLAVRFPPGSSLAMDDFGTGCSDLDRVARVRPEWVKAAAQLVIGCSRSKAQRAVLRALVALAGELGAGLIAEGIEEASDLETCRELGVVFGQGYLLGMPRANLEPR